MDPIFVFLVLVLSLVLYLLPSLVAWQRSHNNSGAIFALNLLLGWTLLGWIASFIWALSNGPKAVVAEHEAIPSIATEAGDRLCPFCAERIQMAAIKCKHCGSELLANPRDMLGK